MIDGFGSCIVRRRFSGALLLMIPVLLLMITAGCISRNPLLLVHNGSRVSFPAILDDLKSSRIVFIGELHDNIRHHKAQLEVIRLLHEAEVPVAVGLEMFQADAQGALDRWVAGTSTHDEFIRVYYANWKMPWPLYRDILLYAREHRIPLVGLNVSPDIVNKVAREGFASLSGDQVRKLPGVSCNVNQEYEAFIRRALGHHGGKTRSFRNFCEAQMVWDSTMAWNVVGFLSENPGVMMVVLAGGGHSWKYGIPEQVRRQSDHSFRVILPELPGRLDRHTVSPAEADYLLLR